MKMLRFFLIILIAGNSMSCNSQTSSGKGGWIGDAEEYRNTISSRHKNPFTKISREQFNQKIDSLIAVAPQLSKEKFIVELFKINSQIEDEHTILFPDNEMELPFKFELFDEGMTIVASDSANQSFLLNRIVSINNIPWSRIDSLYRTLIKRDNSSYIKFFEAYYFNNVDLLKGLDIVNNTSGIPFQFISPSGDTINEVINAIRKVPNETWIYAKPYKNLLAYTKKNNYWYQYDENIKALYFNYRHCSEDENESFRSFNKKLFETIELVKPEKLILDFRFNGGGNSRILKPFIEKIQKTYLNDSGRFFILIGRKVISSALMNVIDLKKTTHAFFIGEATGGNINHFGELKSFELPNSKIKVTYSTKFWENWAGHDGSFHPDFETGNKLSDFINSYDKALETALQK